MITTRYRLAIAVRVLAAIVGGYALAAQGAVCIALLFQMLPDEAVVAGMLASFAIYAAAVVWAFAARSALRACLGLAVAAAVVGGVSALGRHALAG
ncbi:DUF3649 domain-containing protein [Robbsia sp. Bb-Pol-6]|uniref:DUF3649 domain-containing protein n=1 Tax=Robbsia betulipollinis TaxID=2981849 RepID=A0ABT3ZHZ7_9BURK|nr:DUF3649 domain-containing protein [Robbsia betulipollinis]MCY0386047.1 DUF3649 domain-containing protein [Robbsia betulipollinis]